jgi:hypothetical protein
MLTKSSWRSVAAILALATATILQACGSNTSTSTTGSIELSVTPTSATVQQGGSTVVTGSITRTDFTGAVTISVEGAPAGATGTVLLSGDAVTVTIAVASATVTGVYPLTIRAKGAGLSTDATATFTLTIAAASASSYTVTLGPPTLSVAQGGTGTSTVTLVRTNFTGNVAFSVDNLPTGTTAAFAPNPASAGTSVLTLTVGSTTAAGLVNLVIRGTAAGLTDVTAPLGLTVTAAGFTLLAVPTSLSVAQGATNATGGVKATRTGGFTGTITYSLAGAPAGVTAAFATTATTDSMQVSVTATGAVAVGTYPAVIHGISGALDVTTPISIVVTAGTGGGNSVRLDYSACLAASKPVWVAFQDGAGAWTQVTGTADVYTFNIASAKGAIAVVTQHGALFTTAVSFFSHAELVANVGGCGAAAATKVVNGSVAGLNTGDVAIMSLGSSSAAVLTNTTFALPTVLNGTFDLVGYRRNSVTPGVLDRGLLRRDQNIAAAGTLAVADFTSGTESFAAATANVTVAGGGAGDQIFQSMAYLAGAACTSNPLYSVLGSTATMFAMFGVPSTAQRATDFHSLTLSDVVALTGSRSVTVNFHTMADRTITFGALLAPTVTNVTSALAYKRLQAALTLSADYTIAVFSYTDTPGNTVSVFQSAAFLGGNSAVTLTFPDLTAAAGLMTTWFPASGAAVTYSVAGIGAPLTACVEGATTKFTSMTGTM